MGDGYLLTGTINRKSRREPMIDDKDSLRTFLVMYKNGDMILIHESTRSDILEMAKELAKDSNPMESFTDVTNNTWISMFPNKIKGKTDEYITLC